jgi:hypothetical protein
MVYINQRDAFGQVRRSMAHPPSTLVLSLGFFMDQWVDLFGYDDSFIVALFNARKNATSTNEFACSINHLVSIQEARWIWHYTVLPPSRTMRERDFERLTVDG